MTNDKPHWVDDISDALTVFLTENYGQPCPDYEMGCASCNAWLVAGSFDAYAAQYASLLQATIDRQYNELQLLAQQCAKKDKQIEELELKNANLTFALDEWAKRGEVFKQHSSAKHLGMHLGDVGISLLNALETENTQLKIENERLAGELENCRRASDGSGA
jgi:hypothetical protein